MNAFRNWSLTLVCRLCTFKTSDELLLFYAEITTNCSGWADPDHYATGLAQQ